MNAFRLGDVLADPFDRVYRALGSVKDGRIRLVLWTGSAFEPKPYTLPVESLRRAPEDWPQTQQVRAWEANTQRHVQTMARLALEMIGGAK